MCKAATDTSTLILSPFDVKHPRTVWIFVLPLVEGRNTASLGHLSLLRDSKSPSCRHRALKTSPHPVLLDLSMTCWLLLVDLEP